MRKIKVKTLYLIAIVVGGLIGLATKSTYALFTSSTEIDNPICMSTNLTSEEEVVDTLDVVVASAEVKEVPITINNTSGNPLNYMVFYNPTSSDIEIGVNMKNADSSNSLGTINANETKKVYVQIKNNSTSNITITLGVVSNIISSDMNVVPPSGEGEIDINTGNNLVEFITKLYNDTSKTEVAAADSLTYNYATEVNLMNDRLGSSSTDIDGGNIRYYGATPNNYIYFNCDDYSSQTSSTCELWRIIGVFEGKIKIMRNEIIGSFSWDNKNTSTGAETDWGKNDWTSARIMKLLNPNSYYVNDSNDNGNGQSLYWNAESGICFSGSGNATKSCDFTSTGLKNSTTRNMVSESVWYLKGNNSSSVYPSAMYNYERTTGNISSNRVSSWKGNIALLYPSDYGYATDLNQCKKTLNSYSTGECSGNNWMKSIITNNGSVYSWLLTPYHGNYYTAWYVTSGGTSDNYSNDSSYGTRGITPTLYLKSDIFVKQDTIGSISNPYQIVIE